MEDVIIIGAGPAGIMAGISAGNASKKTLILEKNPSIGKKILVSGNGKCNVTNRNFDLEKYHGDKKFLREIFGKFDSKSLVHFLESLGVRLMEEEFGRVMPATNQAETILDALIFELTRLKVDIKCGEEALKAEKANDSNFRIVTKNSTYYSKKLILSAGGCSYPQLGSTKKGFELAKSFGHKIIEPCPALVPLELSGNWFHKLQGVKAPVRLTVKSGDEFYEYDGEILFTKYGISGPVVLDASRTAIYLAKRKDTRISINFMPECAEADLKKILEKQWGINPDKPICLSLSGMIPKKIAIILLKENNISDKKVKDLSDAEKRKIIKALSEFEIKIKGSRPFTESMVTAGGVSTDEINPKTMESNLVKGLYFAGEIIDIDGESGGYNMQFAFSTGYIAGNGN